MQCLRPERPLGSKQRIYFIPAPSRRLLAPGRRGRAADEGKAFLHGAFSSSRTLAISRRVGGLALICTRAVAATGDGLGRRL